MRYEKLTTKFQQILGDAQSLALTKDNAYIDNLHILQTMLADTTNGMGALLVKAGGNLAQIKRDVQAAVDALPKVSGQGGNITLNRETDSTLNLMDKTAMKRGDAYIAS